MIKDDGSVADLTGFSPVGTIHIDSNSVIGSIDTSGNDYLYKTSIPTADTAYHTNITAGSYNYYMNSTTSTPTLRDRNVSDTAYNSKDDTLYRGGNNGFDVIKAGQAVSSTVSNPLISYVTSDYNTGWMHGDIKGAFLSDTDTTYLELITNGTFDSNTNGWTAYHSVAGVDSNRLKIDDTANAGGWSSVVQEVSTVIGKTYQLRFTYTFSSDSFLAGHYAGSYASAGAGTQPTSYTDYGTTSGTYTRIITATTTTTSLVFSVNNAGVSFVDNVSFKLTEEDRSVNNNLLQVFGTVTKTAVATGADLVAYSGFSNSNYLENTSFSVNFGNPPTISIMCWQKITDVSDYSYFISFNDGNANKGGISNGSSSSGYPGQAYFNMGNQTIYTGVAINDGNWHCLVGTISGTDKKFYLDGKEVSSATISNHDMTGVDKIRVGTYGDTHAYSHRGSIALLRVSATVPSPEQIKKIYDDEKHLFQENAKATLYGSSDSVTALAFDDTTNLLHVGTSAGRSDFQGLRRINNTTDAVTTAISASNGLVAEQ